MPPKKKKGAPEPTGLAAAEVASGAPPREVEELARAVEADEGGVLARFRDPLGGHWLLLVSLPIDKVKATPYQRELSEAHATRLAEVIPKVGRFLDPLIAVRADGDYWTPNGMHRLEAMKRLGARSIIALLVPEREIAFRILALNTEKAHNLKDKSLEVVRMADALASDPETAGRPESDWSFEFEEPAYLTIGRCYEKKARYSGSAYMPVVRRLEVFLDEPISETGELRAARADKLIALDKAVDRKVKELKEAGLQSSYLKPFVVARINPLRGSRSRKIPAADFDETVDKMTEKAEAFDATKVKPQDLAGAG